MEPASDDEPLLLPDDDDHIPPEDEHGLQPPSALASAAETGGLPLLPKPPDELPLPLPPMKPPEELFAPPLLPVVSPVAPLPPPGPGLAASPPLLEFAPQYGGIGWGFKQV